MKRLTSFIILLLTTCCLHAQGLVGDSDYTSADEFFKGAYIDIDEWRTEPVRHRYIHGGFRNHETRFSFYFPEQKDYAGHFFQYITPIPDSETLAQNDKGPGSHIGFSLTNGAYFVETNGGGHPSMLSPAAADKTIGAYRANAACAEFSRYVAQKIYGCGRPYGYAFGGSGGAYRTVGGIENTHVWDGAVPFVLGSPMAIPSVFAVRMHAMRVLRNKLPQIVDALEPGGSGNPYEGLNDEETDALREVSKMGFPLGAWYGWKTMGVHAFLALYQGVVKADKQYFNEDFWHKPGYLGTDPTSSIHRDHLDLSAPITEIINQDKAEKMGLVEPMSEAERGSADKAWKSMGKSLSDMPVAFRINQQIPDVGFLGGDMLMLTGRAAKKNLQVLSVKDDYVILAPGASRLALAKIKVGDSMNVNNSNFLAAQTYHRHQVPTPDYYVWNQFRDKDGKPIYPQQKSLIGPMFTRAAAGCVPTGKINVPVIVLCSLLDREAFPWQGDWYRHKVEEHLGDKAGNMFRLWYTDRAIHSDVAGELDDPTEIVSYVGCLHQALLDLSNWVEKGIEPAPNTNYQIRDGQVIVPASAKERRGIQPVPQLTVNGKKRVDIKKGQRVTLKAIVDIPQGMGKLVDAEWSLDNSKQYIRKADLAKAKVSQDGTQVELATTVEYSSSGTYFPTIKVASERKGDAKRIYTRAENLDRVRVVVK